MNIADSVDIYDLDSDVTTIPVSALIPGARFYSDSNTISHEEIVRQIIYLKNLLISRRDGAVSCRNLTESLLL